MAFLGSLYVETGQAHYQVKREHTVKASEVRRYSLHVLLLTLLLAMPLLARADADLDVRALATDLARAIETNADRLHKEEVEGYAPGTESRSKIIEVQERFEKLSQTTPTKRELGSAGHELARLSVHSPELYASIANDPDLRRRIQLAEQTGFQVFVPQELIVQAVEILGKLLDLEKTNPPARRTGKTDRREDRTESSEDLTADLQKMTDPAILRDVANRHIAGMLGDNIYRFYGKLHKGGYQPDEALAVQIMSYFLESGGPAYRFYRAHAFYDPTSGSAIKLGSQYLAKHCRSATQPGFSCFTILTQKALTHASLGQGERQASVLKELDQAIKGHQWLQRAVSAPAGHASDAAVSDRKKAAGELMQYVPGMRDIMLAGEYDDWREDELEGTAAAMTEASAISYWIARAARGNFLRLVADASQAVKRNSLDGNDRIPVLMAGSFMTSTELGDYETALAALQVIRSRAPPSEGAELSSVFDLMQLDLLYTSKQFKNAARLASEMRKSEHFRPRQPERGAALFSVLADCKTAQDFRENPNKERSISRGEYALARLEIALAQRTGASVPIGKLASVMEYEALEALSGARTGQFRPSELVSHWPQYSKALANDKALRMRTATALKCLLARPDLASQVGIDFVNKGGKERQLLNASILLLLRDSGTAVTSGASAIRNEDFVLLQAASIMQAHNGIASATARSAFSDIKIRNDMRDAELRMARISDEIGRLAGSVGLSKAARVMREESPLDTTLSAMLKSPEEFARYSALRNQSIAMLPELQQSLRSGEAAVLLTLFEGKLVTVVAKADSALMVTADISRSAMKSAVTKLLESVNFLSRQSTTLPPAYRADVAWDLYRQLFRPINASLSGIDTVYLVAGEDLASIPFPALVSAPPPSQSAVDFSTYRRLNWLGDKFAFVGLPSAHALLRTSQPANDRSAKLLGVGEPTVSRQILTELRLSPVPDTTVLLTRAGKPVDPPPLLKAHATYRALADATEADTLSDSDILLINSHALVAGQSARYGTPESAILLAPSEREHGADFLDPSKIMSLKLSLRLTMLLACETAGGRTKENSQPYAGLVNSFFFAGSGAVFATNLPVNPAVTEEVAISFLRYVRDDQRPAAKALQKAVADVRCANDSMACAAGEKFVWGHPAYWSQFTLVGSGR